jgi:hypothetical protein
MDCPNLEYNAKRCPCTSKTCANYAKCCDCVAKHRENGDLPACLKARGTRASS